MRIDGILDDETVMMDMGAAIMEFASVLVPLADERRAAPRDDLVSIWANARARWLPDGAVGDGAGDGPVHLGRRGDDAHRHRARARRADAPPRPVGGDGGRPDA